MVELLTVVVQAFLLILIANRYVGRLFLWAFRKRSDGELAEDYRPKVTVVVPLFNEGESVRATIKSLLAQDYPADKLNVIVVDDCSTDGSYLHACRESQRSDRVRVLRNDRNMGKRRSINRAVRKSDAEIIVSVDSDVLVAEDAIRLLMRQFTSPDMAAVGGRVSISNKHDNWLTRMQSIKYFFSYYFTKGLEPAFKSVMCLSGCLTAYRRSVLLELEPLLEARALMGVPIKYGEDRFLTRQIIKAGYKTTMTLDAVCETKAVDNLDGYFAQQLRWRRSNMVDYMAGILHVWRRHPVVAIHYFCSCAGLLIYPTLVAHSLFTGWFWELMLGHLGLTAVMGVIYAVWSRKAERAENRVAPHNILTLGMIAPITYCALLPLAFFTLDSGCWETRGHVDEDAAVEAATGVAAAAGQRQLALAPVIGIQDGKLRGTRATRRRMRKGSASERHRSAMH